MKGNCKVIRRPGLNPDDQFVHRINLEPVQHKDLQKATRSVSLKPSLLNSTLRNQCGQGLIEYLIIVALMGVATIGVMRAMQGSVLSKFASVSAAIQGEERAFNAPNLNTNMARPKDMGSFMKGVQTKSNSDSASSGSY